MLTISIMIVSYSSTGGFFGLLLMICVRTFDAFGECVEGAVLPGTLLPQLHSQVACEVPAFTQIR